MKTKRTITALAAVMLLSGCLGGGSGNKRAETPTTPPAETPANPPMAETPTTPPAETPTPPAQTPTPSVEEALTATGANATRERVLIGPSLAAGARVAGFDSGDGPAELYRGLYWFTSQSFLSPSLGGAIQDQETHTHAAARRGFEHFTTEGVSRQGSGTFLRTLDWEGYGAWGEYNYFRVFMPTTYTDAVVYHDGVSIQGGYGAISDGNFSNSRPVGTSGTATWTGAMVGATRDEIVQGDSTLVYDFADESIDISLTNIHDVDTPERHADVLLPDVSVSPSGRFYDAGVVRVGSRREAFNVSGSFYGPNHEEAGGVFTTGIVDNASSMTGAFGAKRQ